MGMRAGAIAPTDEGSSEGRPGRLRATLGLAERDVQAAWWLALLIALAVGAPFLIVPHLNDAYYLPKLTLFAGSLGLGLAGSLVIWMLTGARPHLPPRTLAAAVGIFIVVLAISVARSVDVRVSIMGEYLSYQGSTTIGLYLFYFLVASSLPAGRRAVVALAGAVVAAAFLSSIYAILQQADIDWHDRIGPGGRPFAGLGQSDMFGIYLAQSLPFAGLLMARYPRTLGLLVPPVVAALVAALILTLSRSAWVGAGASVVIAAALLHRRIREEWRVRVAARGAAATAAVVGGAIVAVLAVGSVIAVTPPGDRIASAFDLDDESAVRSRLSWWDRGIDIAADHPLFGSGPETFASLYPQYREPGDPFVGTTNIRPVSSHNAFIDVGVSAGVLGLAAYGLLLAVCYTPIVRTALDPSGGWRRDAAVAFAASGGAYLAGVFFNFWEVATAWHFWVLTGMGVAITSRKTAPIHLETNRWRTGRRWLWAAPATLAVAAGLVFITALVLQPFLAERNAAQARDAEAAGNFAEATRLYEEAVDRNPLVAQHLLRLGGHLVRRAELEPDDREQLLRRAVDVFHEVDDRFFDRAFPRVSAASAGATLVREFGAPDETVRSDLEAAVRLDPSNATLRCDVVEVYIAIGDFWNAAWNLEWAHALGSCLAITVDELPRPS